MKSVPGCFFPEVLTKQEILLQGFHVFVEAGRAGIDIRNAAAQMVGCGRILQECLNGSVSAFYFAQDPVQPVGGFRQVPAGGPDIGQGAAELLLKNIRTTI